MVKTSKEKTKRKSTEGVPLPRWLGDLLIFFKDQVRPFLNPEEKIISFPAPIAQDKDFLVQYHLLQHINFKILLFKQKSPSAKGQSAGNGQAPSIGHVQNF